MNKLLSIFALLILLSCKKEQQQQANPYKEEMLKKGFLIEEAKEKVTAKNPDFKLKYDALTCFYEGLAGFKVNENWGFINQKGEVVIEAKYNAIQQFFKDGKAMVRTEQKGSVVYENLLIEKNEFVRINQPKLKLQNKDEKRKYQDILESYYVKLKELEKKGEGRKGQYFIINQKSEILEEIKDINLVPDRQRDDKNSIDSAYQVGKPDEKKVLKGGKKMEYIGETREWLLSTDMGEQLTPFKHIGFFREGLAFAGRKAYNDKIYYGYIDETGKTVIEYKFDYATGFKDGVAFIGVGETVDMAEESNNAITMLWCNEKNCKYGLIDKSGKILVEPMFDYVRGFEDGLAMVGINTGSKEGDCRYEICRKYGFIDKTGKVVIGLEKEGK